MIDWLKTWMFGARNARVLDPYSPDSTLGAAWRITLRDGLRSLTGLPVSWADAPRVLDRLDARLLGRMDDWIRSNDPHNRRFVRWSASEFSDGAPESLSAETAEPERAAFLFVLCCSADGHLRERALRLLPSPAGRLGLAAILLRCADWAAPVRALASQRLADALTSNDRAELWPLLAVILAVRKRGRFPDSIWQTTLLPALHAVELADHRAKAAVAGGREERVFALETMASCADPIFTECVVQAVSDGLVRVARWALDPLSAALDDRAALSVIEAALHGPHASIRADGLRALARRDLPAAIEQAQHTLLDQAREPRNAAASLLRTQGHLDPVARWRQAFDHGGGAERSVALSALAEQGDEQDRSRFSDALRSRRAVDRREAYRGLALKCPDDRESALLDGLFDASSGVVREVIRLARLTHTPLPPQLLRDAWAAASAAVRGRLVSALHSIERWNQLLLLLEWLVDAEHPDRAALLESLRAWPASTGRRFTPLSPALRAPIENALDRARIDTDFDPRPIQEVLEAT